MKRIALIAIIAIVSVSSLFSVTVTNLLGDEYAAIAEPYAPMSARMLGMGSAGIAVPGRSDAFFVNPAVLGEGKFELSLPYLQISVYHPYDYLGTDENGKSMISSIIDGLTSENGDFSTAISELFNFVNVGAGKIMDVDAGVSFTANGFALGVFANTALHTYSTVGGLDSDFLAEVNAAAVLGFGHRFELPMDFSLDVGATVRFNYLGYSEAIGVRDVLNDVSGSSSLDFESFFSTKNIIAGWSLPIDLGVNLNMPYGFSFGVVARNLNGNYHMAIQDNYKDALDDPFGNGQDVTHFTLGSDFSLDTGIAWQWENPWLRPTIAVDIVDWVGMCTEPVGFRTFITHLNVGAEVRILSFLDIRAGMSQGYFSLGAGLDLWAIKVDMAYYWKEFGETAGDVGLDAFTVRINIGFDK